MKKADKIATAIGLTLIGLILVSMFAFPMFWVIVLLLLIALK